MTNWQLKIDIKNEIKELKEFAEKFPQTYVFEGENETKYIELCKKLTDKFSNYEEDIKRITDDDGTWESLENNLEDLEMSIDLENSNFNMELIYELCDVAGIWLIQI